MTDIIFRPRSQLLEESELPMWWRTIDKWSLFSLIGLFLCGLLLGMAASIPLAESNSKDAFYYVKRQLLYGIFSFFIIAAQSTSISQLPQPASLSRFKTRLKKKM